MLEGDSTSSTIECIPNCRRNKKKLIQSEWDENLFESFLQCLLLSATKNKTRLQTSTANYVASTNTHNKSESYNHLTHLEKEHLYVEVLYTIKHKIGSTSGGHSPFIEDLFNYAQRVFNISDTEHRSLLLAASEEKPPIVVLNATVIQARNLEAKDADGLSDPYVMLGIIPGKVSDDQERDLSDNQDDYEAMDKNPKGMKQFGKSNKKKTTDKCLVTKLCGKKPKGTALKESIPAKFIQTTSVKANTLNPLWNELFHFDIENVQSDKLHLDIWDHDDEENVFDAVKRLNQIRGVKGLTRYFKQVGQSARSSDGNVDDFLGCLTVDLDNIPSVGKREWFNLEGRCSKSQAEGEMELDIKLSTREHRNLSAEGNWLDVLQHQDLLKMFISYELQCCTEGPKSWKGELREEAETILHQHAIQGDITELQILVCRWLAISDIYSSDELDQMVLINILSQMEKCWQPGILSRDEIHLLAKSYKQFIAHCLESIKKFRYKFPAYNEHKSKCLQQTLRMLALIANSNIYKSVSPFENDLSSQQVSVLKSAAVEFFDSSLVKFEKEAENEEKDGNNTLLKYLQLVKTVNMDLLQLEDFYHDIFAKSSKINVLPLTYKVYNKKLYKQLFESDNIGNLQHQFNTIVCDFESFSCYKSFIDLFSLYSNLQQFNSYQDVLITDDFRSFESIDSKSWFKPIFDQWILFIKHKLEKNIDYQIDRDEMETPVDQTLLCSASAINVTNTFEVIEHIWKRMQWVDLHDKMAYVTTITKLLGDCGLLYADTLHEKVRLAGYFDECGQFDLSHQVCIALNNITQINLSLDRLSIDLGFDQVATEIISTSGYKQAGKTFIESLFVLSKESRDHIMGVIISIIQRVTGKMRPEIRKNIFHLCWSPQSVSIEKASSDLRLYLMTNISVVKKKLNSTIFSQAMLTIWSEVLEQVLEQANKEFDEKADVDTDSETEMFVINRLYKCLDILFECFCAIDDNVTTSQLDTDQFKSLKYLLLLYQANTKEIVEFYFKEKQMEQDNNTSAGEYGSLNLRVYYRRSSGTLVVDIINATGLQPLDSNGLSDPFVILELAPYHFFNSSMKPLKTKIIKNTLDPEFNESFEIAVRLDQIVGTSATLVLIVMDHDMLMTDDFEGVIFVNLSTIPGINAEINNPSTVPSITLNLIRSKFEVNKALYVLSKQISDNYAHDFVKKWMVLETG